MDAKRSGLLSIVVPAYNEEKMIPKAADKMKEYMEAASIDYEIIFVNDGSSDATWTKILEESKKNKKVRGLCFSRNFGKESAIFAGLEGAKGDCAVVIDCDLQHPPEKIIEMYQLWQKGYDVVEGIKTSRGEESFFHSLAAKGFYDIISHVTAIDMDKASDFKLLDRQAVNVLLNMRETHAFFRALSSWIGFETTSVGFEVQERQEGTTKWSTKALVKYAISNITSFSSAPLQIVTILGILMMLVSVVLGLIALIEKFKGLALGGFTTVIIIQLFTGSIVMISLGIIGYYIAKIYEEIKARPRYIVSKKTED